jgi:tyrosinase
MSDIQELHNQTIAFLSQPPNDLSVAVAAGEVEHLGGEEMPKFSVFVKSHLEHALQIAAKFMQIANEEPGENGLTKVLAEAEKLTEIEDNEVIKYALKVFITHHPEGNILPIPSFEQSNPDEIAPSQPVLPPGVDSLGSLGDEARLDYFREDTAVNEHHTKWHVVYPFGGVPNPANPFGPRITKPRQGELFWYMHQQMLARYDTERKSHGLDVTKSLKDFQAPIDEGYDANLSGYGNRLPNLVMQNISGYTVARHATFRDRLFTAAQSGKFQNGTTQIPINNASILADTVESNVGAALPSRYGDLHNMGHVLIAALSNPRGVMRSTSTAVRDPVFFRWHRLVDDVIFEWQQILPAYDFSVDAPNVSLRKELNAEKSPDILLCFKKDIPEASDPNFDGQNYGEQHFGGANWDAPLSTFPFLTSQLQTTMKIRKFTDSNGNSVEKNYLDFEEFYYFLRLENNDAQTRKVTVRIFLATSEFAADRRYWIEMDKFPVELSANQKMVVFRPSRLSSIARKPAFRPSENPPPPPVGAPNDNYCDCGWAYHLLLPRGNENGMDFRFLIMLTDWQLDSVGEDKKCGSMSFCGAKDKEYPDKRPMGYPFDRPFKNLSIADTVKARPNLATRDLKIKFIPPS